MVLEGESLLNDASALLIYKIALAAVAAGSFSMADAIPTFALVVVGSIAVGWLLAWPVGLLIAHIEHAPTSVILQFVITFAIWLAAERVGLSAVVTIVVFGMSAARRSAFAMPARLRVPSFAIWESVTFVLNVLAFTLIGLQLRPILEGLNAAGRFRLVDAALAILAVVIVIRLVWVMSYTLIQLPSASQIANPSMPPLTVKAGLVIGWSGMRGIVTRPDPSTPPHSAAPPQRLDRGDGDRGCP
jgi:CPA1 family monovalent cation:H+ antiporter